MLEQTDHDKVNIKDFELSASTVAFISCRGRLTKVLADAARGEKGSKGGVGQVRLSNVDTRRLMEFQYKLIYCFKLAADMVRGSIWEIVNHTDRKAFLGLGLMGTSKSEFTTVQMDRYPFTCFKSI